MAKKEEFDLDFDEDDSAMDFDFDDDNFNFDEPNANKKDRKPLEVMRASVLESTKAGLSADEIKDKVRKVLPDGYTSFTDTVSDYTYEGKELIDKAKKEVSKGLGRIRQEGGKLVRAYENVLPGPIARALKKITDVQREEMERRRSEEEQQRDHINEQLNAISAAQLELQKAAEAKEMLRDEMTNSRFQSQQELLYGLKVGVERQSAYQEQVASKFHSQQLQVGYLQLFAQRNILKTVQESAAHQKTALEAIVKNTALPDFVKAQNRELLKETMIRKTMGVISNKITDYISGFKDNVIKNAKDYAGGVLSTVTSGLDMAADSAGQLADMKQMANEFEGPKTKAQMGGEVLGKLIANWMVQTGVRGTINKLDKNGKLSGGAERLHRFIKFLPQNANDWKKNNQDSGNIFKNFLANLLPGFDEKNTGHDMTSSNRLNDTAEFDVAARKSIVDIIPGLLAQIHLSTEGIRHSIGSTEVLNQDSLLEWDHESGEFARRGKLDKRLNKRILEGSGVDKQIGYISRLVDLIDRKHELPDGLRRRLVEELVNSLGRGRGFKASDFIGRKWGVSMTPDEIRVVEQMISESFPDDRDLQKSLNVEAQRRATEIQNLYNNAESTRGYAQDYIHKLSLTSDTQARRMQRLGVGEINERGFTTLNSGIYNEEVTKRSLRRHYSSGRHQYDGSFSDIETDRFRFTSDPTYESDGSLDGGTVKNPRPKEFLVNGKRKERLTYEEWVEYQMQFQRQDKNDKLTRSSLGILAKGAVDVLRGTGNVVLGEERTKGVFGSVTGKYNKATSLAAGVFGGLAKGAAATTVGKKALAAQGKLSNVMKNTSDYMFNYFHDRGIKGFFNEWGEIDRDEVERKRHTPIGLAIHHMLEDGKTDAEIEDYLNKQLRNVKNEAELKSAITNIENDLKTSISSNLDRIKQSPSLQNLNNVISEAANNVSNVISDLGTKEGRDKLKADASKLKEQVRDGVSKINKENMYDLYQTVEQNFKDPAKRIEFLEQVRDGAVKGIKLSGGAAKALKDDIVKLKDEYTKVVSKELGNARQAIDSYSQDRYGTTVTETITRAVTQFKESSLVTGLQSGLDIIKESEQIKQAQETISTKQKELVEALQQHVEIVDTEGNLLPPEVIEENVKTYLTEGVSNAKEGSASFFKTIIDKGKDNYDNIKERLAKSSPLLNRGTSSTEGDGVFDVYIKGETEPRLLASKLRKGEYFNVHTKEPIYRIDDINGPIMDADGNVLITTDDLLNKGVTDKVGKEYTDDTLKEKLRSGGSGFVNAVKGGSWGLTKWIVGGLAKGLSKPFRKTMYTTDVYLPDENGGPPRLIMSRWGIMRGNQYFTAEGKPIRYLKDITGAVYDKYGDVIATAEEMARAVDKKGRPLSKSYFVRRFRQTLDVYKGIAGAADLVAGRFIFGKRISEKLREKKNQWKQKALNKLGFGHTAASEGTEDVDEENGIQREGFLRRQFSKGTNRLKRFKNRFTKKKGRSYNEDGTETDSKGVRTEDGIVVDERTGKARSGNYRDISKQQDEETKARTAAAEQRQKDELAKRNQEKKENPIIKFLKDNLWKIFGVGGVIAGMFTGLGNLFKDGLWGATKKIVGGLWEGLKWIGQGAWKLARYAVTGIGEMLLDGLKAVGGWIKDGASALWDKAKGLFGGKDKKTPGKPGSTKPTSTAASEAGKKGTEKAAQTKAQQKAAEKAARKAERKIAQQALRKTGTTLLKKGAGRLALGFLGPIGGAILLGWTLFDIGSWVWGLLSSPNKIDDFRYAAYGINPQNDYRVGLIQELEEWMIKRTYTDRNGTLQIPELDLNNKDLAVIISKFIGDSKGKEAFAALAENQPEETKKYSEGLENWLHNRFVPVFYQHAISLAQIDPKMKLSDAFGLTGDLDNGLVYPWLRRAYFPADASDNPYGIMDDPFFLDPEDSDEAYMCGQAEVDHYYNIVAKAYERDEKALREKDKRDREKANKNAQPYTSKFEFEERSSRFSRETSVMANQVQDTVFNNQRKYLSNKDGTKAETEINGNDVYVLSNVDDVLLNNQSIIDDGIAIRMRVYGLHTLVETRVRTLLRLEQTMLKYVRYNGAKASFDKFDFTEIYNKFGTEFGWISNSQEDYEYFKAWFTYRFTPAYLAFVGLVHYRTGSSDIFTTMSGNKVDNATKYEIYKELTMVKTNIDETEVDIWKITFKLIKGIDINQDSGTITNNLLNIFNNMDAKILTEKDPKGTTVNESDLNKARKGLIDATGNTDMSNNNLHRGPLLGGGMGLGGNAMTNPGLGLGGATGTGEKFGNTSIAANDYEGTGGTIQGIKWKQNGQFTPHNRSGAAENNFPIVKDLLAEVAKMVGVDAGVLTRMAYQESKFDANAKASTSSATGLFQFINGTWAEMQPKLRKYGAEGLPPTHPVANAIAGAIYLKDNLKTIKGAVERAGKSLGGGAAYVAHFMGPGGARQLYNAIARNPNAIAAQMFPKQAAANKSIFYKDGNVSQPRTVSELEAFVSQTKMLRPAQNKMAAEVQQLAGQKVTTAGDMNNVTPTTTAGGEVQDNIATSGSDTSATTPTTASVGPGASSAVTDPVAEANKAKGAWLDQQLANGKYSATDTKDAVNAAVPFQEHDWNKARSATVLEQTNVSSVPMSGSDKDMNSSVLESGSSGVGSKKASKAADIATQRAKPKSSGYCAKYVSDSLLAAGYKFNKLPSAFMYNNGTMEKMGFKAVGKGYNFNAMKGDVMVLPAHGGPGGGGKHGHIQIFNGTNWVSDFVQRSNRPNQHYLNVTPNSWRDINGGGNNATTAGEQPETQEVKVDTAAKGLDISSSYGAAGTTGYSAVGDNTLGKGVIPQQNPNDAYTMMSRNTAPTPPPVSTGHSLPTQSAPMTNTDAHNQSTVLSGWQRTVNDFSNNIAGGNNPIFEGKKVDPMQTFMEGQNKNIEAQQNRMLQEQKQMTDGLVTILKEQLEVQKLTKDEVKRLADYMIQGGTIGNSNVPNPNEPPPTWQPMNRQHAPIQTNPPPMIGMGVGGNQRI